MQNSSNLTVAPASNGPALSQAAQSAWKVTFTTSQPAPMPSDRLQARAQIVSNALTSGVY